LVIIENGSAGDVGDATTTIDAATTTLTASVGAWASTLKGGDVIKVGSEYMLVTRAISTTQATVIRGYAGSTAVAHTAGVKISAGDIHILNKSGIIVPIPATAGSTDLTNTGYIIAANDSKTFIVKMDTSDVATGVAYSGLVKIDTNKVGWRDGVQTSNITSLTGVLPIESSLTWSP
jgi:hypothetical protein